jgi:2-octaprenyl-6-methoxyphenol hydroxylase
MKNSVRSDIFVAGGGLAGKSAALAFAAAGFSVAIAAPTTSQTDQRTTALMMPAIQFLDSLGIWKSVMPNAAPMHSMRIIDATKRLIRARMVTFNAAQINEEAFGWNIPNTALNATMDQMIDASPSIALYKETVTTYEASDDDVKIILEGGMHLFARLVAGADGRNSPARARANIKTINWSYPQTAFVTTFDHRLPHANTSTEFHTESGPCVQVPLPGNRSSLVWVVTPQKAALLQDMDEAQLSYEIEMQLFSILGTVSVCAERQIYPLSGQYPEKFAQNRIALLGEAAHVFPPIGAQGFNLALRDVEDLRNAAISNPVDPGAPQVLAQYDRSRRPDVLTRTGAVNALNRSLLSTLIPAQFARAFGLAIIDSTPPLRGLFMREGMRPGSGVSALVASFTKVFTEKHT